MTSWSRVRYFGLFLPLLALSDARAADHAAGVAVITSTSSLGVSMFEAEPEAAWPIDLEWEIVEIAEPGSTPHVRRTQTPSGHQVMLTESVAHDTGHDIFRLTASARHHALQATELEYRLTVHRARFKQMPLTAYVQHRFGVGPAPALESETLEISRADILSGVRPVAEQEVEIDGRPYIVRVRAAHAAG